MRTAYIDAFAGASGDMLLGALIHAGVPLKLLQDALDGLAIGARLEVSEVSRAGIQAIKANILVGDALAEEHDSHEHGRSLSVIQRIISAGSLPKPVESLALRAFELLAAAESKIHGIPVEAVHFHEVGAVDAIADIVLTAVAADHLKVDGWHCSPVNVGGGVVKCAHGILPVPAPATAELLREKPTYSSGAQMELVTPTGAALLRALECAFGASPPVRVAAIGYGAGTKNPADFPNVTRISIGDSTVGSGEPEEHVLVLEAAVDDMNPQIVAYVSERALKFGALDVMASPVIMKKGRSGTLITVLADHAHAPALEKLLLEETTTLGMRIHEERRVRLAREHCPVTTPWGSVRIKLGRRNGIELSATPEFEDCRTLAEASNVPVKRVIEVALNNYRQSRA